jgi:cyclophilin family peptidyl-prolyl cis-trans isomerase
MVTPVVAARAPLSLTFERSSTLDLFLAVQRELTGRFAQEIALLPTPVVPEIAQFRHGIRAWQAAGLRTLPDWLARCADPARLADGMDDVLLRHGARQVADALAAAGPILGPALDRFEDVRATARRELDRLLPLAELDVPYRAALGVGAGQLTLPLHLVPLAPHYPGVGFLTDGSRWTRAYADCRRLTGSILADSVLTVLGWALLHAAPGPDSLWSELARRLPGEGRPQRRLRAILAKVLVETTAASLVRVSAPEHRAGADVLGTAWRYPRLHGVASRYWGRHLAGLADRAEALAGLCGEIRRVWADRPGWYVEDVDASSLAADFYLLEWLAAAGGPGAAERLLAGWVPQLADYLAGQIDLIIGGELGHFERSGGRGTPEPVGSFLARVTAGDSRVAWWRLRRELGQSRALRLAVEAFSTAGIEYGGEAWGPVAATLVRYVDCELPPAVFVDQCFTLEHNNGSLFDKYFATGRLRTVLDAQAAGDLGALSRYASAEVRTLWREHQARQFGDVDPDWLGLPAAPGAPASPPPGRYRLRAGALDVGPGALGCGMADEDPLDGAVPESVLPGPGAAGRAVRKALPPVVLGFRHATALLHTDLGDIEVQLWPEHAPYTVAAVIGLARGTRAWTDPLTRRPGVGGFYDGTTFYRRIPGFLVEGGDRTGTGEGGPGFRIPDEIRPTDRFDRPYLVGLANTGPNSAGSRLFVTLAAAPHLDGLYCRFGAVTDAASRAVLHLIAEHPQPVRLHRMEPTTW